MSNYEEESKKNYDFLLSEIKSAKAKGKRSIKVKTFQALIKDGHPSNVYFLKGICKGSEAVNNLKSLGYKVDFISTDKQLNVNTGVIRPLKTTNIIVGW